MTEPVLDGSDVVARVSEGVAAAVAEHVTVDGKLEASPLSDALDQPINRVGRERAAPLGTEDVLAVRKLTLQLPQRADLVTPKRMNAGLAVLHPAEVQGRRSAELDLGPFQVGYLSSPQAMAEGHQDQRGVAVAVATILGRQVFPGPQLGIGGPNWN
jgi:hypothetical protein